jgi:serine protease Do
MRSKLKGILILFAVLVVLVLAAVGGAIADRFLNIPGLNSVVQRTQQSLGSGGSNPRVVLEENVVIDVVKQVSPSVVTVQVQTPSRRVIQFSPFGGFSQSIQGGQPQDIGSGFIVSKDGLIVTNKHVVSDTTLTYKVITSDGKEYPVSVISRDPSNDIAVIKIDPPAGGLTPITFGDSTNLQVGQFVIAIGTALGEFRNTVTTGVVSGLGRGITAGSDLQGYVEQLDNVIQTDAAINPGNSGGPLLNSSGQVIGINVAVASGAQNIGFAIPVNVVTDALNQYNKTGKFAGKSYLGVEYQIVPKQSAVLNNVPEGAYVVNVISGSPADKAGVQVDDIITKIDGESLNESNTLANVIKNKKVGDIVQLSVYRNGQTLTLSATLSDSGQ